MQYIVTQIQADLQAQSNPEVQQSTQRFFKTPIKQYGLKSADTKKIGQTYYNTIKHLSKYELFNLCQQLWQSGFIEETLIAAQWSEKCTKQFTPSDIDIFKSWIENYVTNWASCDTFCNHTVGNLITMYPQLIPHLKQWATSNNMWLRRAAAVSLIVPAKKGQFLTDVFDITNILLKDQHDLVQKGYGWLLKVAANKHQMAVFNYVVANKAIMPRTALRYAIEKMPPELRKTAMLK